MDHFVPTPDQLAVLLRNIRKEKGLTQAKAAQGAGLLPKTVSLLENSPHRCSVENLFKLLSFLDREVHLLDKNTDSVHESYDGEW
jgi:HTH-type transcriptional regulator / antitoxin HipB